MKPLTLWTDQMLAEWRESVPADWPEWRRDFYTEMRRQNCPTYRERRAQLRNQVKRECLDQIRKARSVPGWLTALGQQQIRRYIAMYRAEHRALVASDPERGRPQRQSEPA